MKRYSTLKTQWKDTQHWWLLKKCKSKLQWGITSHWSEWPSSSKKKDDQNSIKREDEWKYKKIKNYGWWDGKDDLECEVLFKK